MQNEAGSNRQALPSHVPARKTIPNDNTRSDTTIALGHLSRWVVVSCSLLPEFESSSSLSSD